MLQPLKNDQGCFLYNFITVLQEKTYKLQPVAIYSLIETLVTKNKKD